jgi:hypothetical protein
MPKPVTSRAVHVARLEMAVARLAPLLWSRVAPSLERWVRARLRVVLPMLEFRVAPRDTESQRLAQLLEQIGATVDAPRGLEVVLFSLSQEIAIEHGFLPRDPRAAALRAELTALLESDAGQYWRNLTDPQQLANRIIGARQRGATTAQITRDVIGMYRSSYWSAERLVRTTYTAAANLAQWQALRAAGYTEKVWLTSRDARVRRAGPGSRFDHVRMDGIAVGIDATFSTPGGSRMRFPGDRSLGAFQGDLSNCRCTIIGVNPTAR